MHKDVRKFVQSLTVIDGVTCAVNGGGHIKIMKDGKTVATMPHTPGDHRWRNNILRDLRSVGITPSGKLDREVRIMNIEGMTQEELRDSLEELRGIKGQLTEFGRFVFNEAAPMLRTAAYKSENSTIESLRIFAVGETLTMPDDKFAVIAESLRLWRTKQKSELRGLAFIEHHQQTDGFAERDVELETRTEAALERRHLSVVEEPVPTIGREASQVVVEISLDSINRILEGFGIRLTVQPTTEGNIA